MGENEAKRPQFGNRLLTEERNVFEHNAWDNVIWDEEQEAEAQKAVEKNSMTPVSEVDKEKYEKEADQFWDKFYMQHQNRFFKDRHWLFTEFPELAPQGVPEHIAEKASGSGPTMQNKTVSATAIEKEDIKTEESGQAGVSTRPCDFNYSAATFPGEHGTMRILEVGCGVGNTVFPILQTNNDPGLFVYCCDLSSTAIQLVREHADYTASRCHAFVCDVTDETILMPFPVGSLDIIVLIFVLSAIHPDKMESTVHRLAKHLKPGGMIVFRDYGRYDLAQLRFKNGRCLSENFYVRGDGTRVYFFTQADVREMFSKAGLEEEQNLIDRRLQVNRGRQLKMYRVWIQCKYRKPTHR